MAIAPNQTQAEFFKKLEAWVPKWFFESPDVQDAAFQAWAKMFECIDLNIAEAEDQTYICRAIGACLEEHARERNLVRGSGEGDASLQERTKNIVNQNNCPAIKSIVDELLCVGESTIIEADSPNQPFFDRQDFYNRDVLYTDADRVNFFTIVIPDQEQPSLECFYDRGGFYNRDDCFYSSFPRANKEEVYTAITDAVNKNKAYGVLYFVVVTSP